MAIHIRYRWDSEDYRKLIYVCKQPNLYRYGALLPEDPGRQPRGTVVIQVPEGFVVLAQKPLYPRAFKFDLQDLLATPITLTPLTIRFMPEFSRVCLVVNKTYLKSKGYMVHDLSHRAHYFAAGKGQPRKVKKTQGEYFKAVNNITRELIGFKRWVFIPLTSQRAYDRMVRWCAYEYLTSVLHHKKSRADQEIKQYLVPLLYTRGRRVDGENQGSSQDL